MAADGLFAVRDRMDSAKYACFFATTPHIIWCQEHPFSMCPQPLMCSPLARTFAFLLAFECVLITRSVRHQGTPLTRSVRKSCRSLTLQAPLKPLSS
jgi:hypothetical protein